MGRWTNVNKTIRTTLTCYIVCLTLGSASIVALDIEAGLIDYLFSYICRLPVWPAMRTGLVGCPTEAQNQYI